MKRHLSDAELIDLRFDTLEGEPRKGLAKHLKSCATCRQRAATLEATLGQLTVLRDEDKASEELIARTLRAARGATEPATAPPPPQRIAWRRIAWMGIAAAAAVVLFTVLPPLLRPNPANDLALLSEKTAPRPVETDAALTLPAQRQAVPRVPEPPPKPAEARPKMAASDLDKRLAQTKQATGGAAGAPAAKARAATLSTAPVVTPAAMPAPLASPQPAAPGGVSAIANSMEQEIAADITVRVPSTSGTWLTGPQNAIRVRATRRDREVEFLFVNQGSILAARIRIMAPGGSNQLQTVFLPPLARTNLTLKTK